MHAPRREPFWPDGPDQPRTVDIANRIALVRRYALVLPGLILILAIGATWLTDTDLVAIWREVPAVRLGAVGLAAWLAGGVGWLLVEAVGLWVCLFVHEYPSLPSREISDYQ
jgi:hypothetical protein